MSLAIFILMRLLVIGSLVFILGYVFGNFSRNATLTTITKVASIFLLAAFIGANVFFASQRWKHGNFNRTGRFENCFQKDSTTILKK